MDRELEGTWVSIELKLAIAKGYKVVEVFLMHHWEKSSLYDKNTKSGGLFAKYVNYNLKKKIEASGLPPNVKSEAEINEYINYYLEREGVQLDATKIEHSDTLRTLAKIMLNSLW
jgi:hypothetical protein